MLVSDFLPLSAALLSDPNQDQWTNDALLPYAKLAHNELELALFAEGFRELEEVTTPLEIPANTTSFVDAAILPADFVQILSLRTRVSADDSWGPKVVEKDANFDLTEELDTIQYYCFRDNDIKVNPASQALYGLLTYRRTLAAVTAVGSTVSTPLSISYYSYNTAALAAAFKGINVDRGTALKASAMKFKDELVAIEIRNQQGVSFRRRPGYSNKYGIKFRR